jgi:hypothetical protein
MAEGETTNANLDIYDKTRSRNREIPLLRPPLTGYAYAEKEALGPAELRNGKLRLQQGRYRGMHPSKAAKKFREDYAALSDEEKDEMTRRAQGDDVMGPMDRDIKTNYDNVLTQGLFGADARSQRKKPTEESEKMSKPNSPEYTPDMSDYERRQIGRVKNIQANWAGNQAEYDMNQAGKVAIQQRRAAHDEAFRRAYGTQPVQPTFYRENWNGGNRRPTGPGETVVDQTTRRRVTPRINGVSPQEAIDASKKKFEENAALDRRIGVGNITRGINSNGYPNPAPRTDIKGVGYSGNYDPDDVRQWRTELAMQKSMQAEGRKLQSEGKTKEFADLQSEYNHRFGNVSQAEMQVRGRVLGQDYVGANRKIYDSRYRSTPLKPPSQHKPAPKKPFDVV